jgi:hypothetical protein
LEPRNAQVKGTTFERVVVPVVLGPWRNVLVQQKSNFIQFQTCVYDISFSEDFYKESLCSEADLVLAFSGTLNEMWRKGAKISR